MEPAHLHYPWRQLGDLLVDEGLLTEHELKQALLEQARSGRLLGQIAVSLGYVSAFSLARVLSEQHGVQVRQPDETEAATLAAFVLADPPEFGESEKPTDASWRPLGKILLERGFLTEFQLQDALEEQREAHGRLGEILVSRRLLSGTQLAQALAEQHGVELDSPEQELETAIMRTSADEPMYNVCEVHFEPGFQRRTSLYESPNFLDAADYAFEFVEENDPVALEINRSHGAAQETVWSYSASRAAAAATAQKSLIETFGFDPTRWGHDR
ncbi:hypothetical protein BH18ACT12_BH18ACT12_01500 [soil metagenome]